MHSKNKSSQSGQVLVEFALVTLVFWVIVMGTFDVGRIMLRVHQLTQVAREGARAASLAGDINNVTIEGLVREKMRKVLNSMNLEMSDVNIRMQSVDATGDGLDEVVEITVSQPINQIIGISLIPGLNDEVAISSTISMPILFRQNVGG